MPAKIEKTFYTCDKMAQQMTLSFKKLYFWHALCYVIGGLMPQKMNNNIKIIQNYGKDYWN
jgi:hypothetical protein